MAKFPYTGNDMTKNTASVRCVVSTFGYGKLKLTKNDCKKLKQKVKDLPREMYKSGSFIESELATGKTARTEA